MKILAITDSLGLPRSTPEYLPVEKTWLNLLSEFHEVVCFSYGGATIDQFFSQIEYLKLYKPDCVLIQSGIVDCAPRALTKTENIVINHFKLTRFLFSKFVSENDLFVLRNVRDKTYTPLSKFEYYINQFISIFGEKLYWIGILPTLPGYEKKVPGIIENVRIYNELIETKLGERFISTRDFNELDIMTDFIHLSVHGNSRLLKLILNKIQLQ